MRKTLLAAAMSLAWLAVVLTPIAAVAQVDETAAEETTETDPYGRTTPRGTVEGYLSAIREADLQKASLFLDLRGLSGEDGQIRASDLRELLDSGGSFLAIEDISAQPDGDLSDEMSADLENVGTLHVLGRDVPLVLQRVDITDGSLVWLFSRDTVAQLPALHAQSTASPLDQLLPDALKTTTLFSVPLGHWVAIIVIAILTFALGYLGAKIVLQIVLWSLPNRWSEASTARLHGLRLPLGLFFGVLLYREVVVMAGVQVVARGSTDWIFSTLFWSATAVLCLRIVDLVAELLSSAVEYDAHRKSLAALILTRKIAKAVIIAILAIQVLEILGFDVTTAIAALGIGGLAFALGAQKTVENLVGSVIVVADRPVEVGDFCKFGDVSGTVEDIGIRSTQIRTPERTIVTVPNRAFASMQIENYSVRDRFLFHRVLSLKNDIPPDQISNVIESIRAFMAASDFISDASRVNLVDLGTWSIEVEILCYIEAPDFAAFVKRREALVFSLLDSVKAEHRFLVSPQQAMIA